jgi:hypothetical protein
MIKLHLSLSAWLAASAVSMDGLLDQSEHVQPNPTSCSFTPCSSGLRRFGCPVAADFWITTRWLGSGE